jgi:hypothetical protein
LSRDFYAASDRDFGSLTLSDDREFDVTSERLGVSGNRAHRPTTKWRSASIMRALDPEVKEAVWQAIEPIIPVPVDHHPLGRHRRRKSDRACSGTK